MARLKIKLVTMDRKFSVERAVVEKAMSEVFAELKARISPKNKAPKLSKAS